MHDDDPTDAVHDEFAGQLFGDTPLAADRRHGCVDRVARDRPSRLLQRRYRPENTVVAVAGNVDHATVVRQVRKAFAEAPSSAATPARCLPAPARRAVRRRGEEPSSSRGAPSRPTSSSASRPWRVRTSAGSRSAC
jgi:predicted Zn-dependent peptidase